MAHSIAVPTYSPMLLDETTQITDEKVQSSYIVNVIILCLLSDRETNSYAPLIPIRNSMDIASEEYVRLVHDPSVKNYMRFSTFGIMLLAISNEDAKIYLLPYPPFGLVTISFMGISSYLLMVGIYYSSVSTSINSQIRSMIERSVNNELSFLSNIGRSQMEKQILNRIKELTERFAEDLTEDSGVVINLKTEEIVHQLSLVMKEKEAMTQKKITILRDKHAVKLLET